MVQFHSNHELFERFANQADPIALAKMDKAQVLDQISALWDETCDADPLMPTIEDVASGILDEVQTVVRRKAEERFANTPELEYYHEEAFYDWGSNMAKHYAWLCEAPVAEIVEWAEELRDTADAAREARDYAD